ncbi:MAG: asparagine synthase C-terminal domain-containing protein [Thermoplasmata archaeon]|nr:asparagine synthase C-terminal domain-containing protein [Thermoplasmata archaeon]
MQRPPIDDPAPLANEAAELARLLRKAVENLVPPGTPTSLLYSGGLDSSAVARAFPPSTTPQLVVMGVRGSPDLTAARTGAAQLDLPLHEHVVDRTEVERALERWATELESVREPARSVLVASALAVAAAPTELVLCGQGADELFHGYAHFEGLTPPAAQARSAADLRRLHEVDWPWIRRWASELGHELASPYLDLDLLAWTRTLSPDVHRDSGGRKPLLRQAALELGVSAELANRPKRALQYGSGVRRLVGELDRARRGRRPPSAR